MATEKKSSPIDRAIAKFGDYFEQKGLKASDLPAAIIVHEFLGMIIAVTAWTVSILSEE